MTQGAILGTQRDQMAAQLGELGKGQAEELNVDPRGKSPHRKPLVFITWKVPSEGVFIHSGCFNEVPEA